MRSAIGHIVEEGVTAGDGDVAPTAAVHDFRLSARYRAAWSPLIHAQTRRRHLAAGNALEIIVRRCQPVARVGRRTNVRAEMYSACG